MGNMARIWIARDPERCSGCRRCEIACSLYHEGRIWPEASRIRIFMLVPGVEIPHFCVQCEDYPCVEACPVKALSVDPKTGAVLVDKEKCTGCSICIQACPGKIPHIHPTENYALICDLCGGTPQCVKACQEAGYFALRVVERPEPDGSPSYKLYAKDPELVTKELAYKLYGEKAKELL